MPAPGRPKGSPKTGGRQKGTRNKASAALVAEISKTGETPAEYMLRVMRDPTVEHDRRDKMAAAVAPYVHPKLASIEHAGEGGGPIKHKVEIAFVRTEAEK